MSQQVLGRWLGSVPEECDCRVRVNFADTAVQSETSLANRRLLEEAGERAFVGETDAVDAIVHRVRQRVDHAMNDLLSYSLRKVGGDYVGVAFQTVGQPLDLLNDFADAEGEVIGSAWVAA